MNKAAREIQYENKRNKRRSHLLSYILPAAALVIVGTLMTAILTCGVRFEIICGGEIVGYVSDMADYKAVKERVEDTMSEILGVKYKFGGDVKFRLSFGEFRQITPSEDLYNRFYEISGENLTEAYALYIDRKLVAASEEMSVLESALQRVVDITADKYGCTVDIANSYFYAVRPVPGNYILTEDEIVALLCGTQADTSSEDAEAITVSAESIYEERYAAEREYYGFSNMYYKEEDYESESEVRLLFKTTVNEEYIESVPYKTVYEDSDEYYEGMTYVKRNGENGKRSVLALASYVDGEEVDRVIISSETIEEPTDKIVLVGTKPKPSTAPTGTFIIPINNPQITSKFGWRNVFGENGYHYGIDLMAAVGTTVYASDGGTVEIARTSGAYGLVIRISHGGKYETIYAHLSKLLVSEGDEVYQGQPIALSGNTGRVTGPHLHFEVFEFGVRKNPAQFLKNITPDMILELSAEEMEQLRKTAKAFMTD